MTGYAAARARVSEDERDDEACQPEVPTQLPDEAKVTQDQGGKPKNGAEARRRGDCQSKRRRHT